MCNFARKEGFKSPVLEVALHVKSMAYITPSNSEKNHVITFEFHPEVLQDYICNASNQTGGTSIWYFACILKENCWLKCGGFRLSSITRKGRALNHSNTSKFATIT